MQFHAYSTPVTLCPASQSQAAEIAVGGGFEFWLHHLIGNIQLDATGFVPSFGTGGQMMPDVKIFDGSSLLSFQNRDNTRFRSVLGTAQFPFRLPRPHFFGEGRTLTAVVNNPAVTAIRFQLTLTGGQVTAFESPEPGRGDRQYATFATPLVVPTQTAEGAAGRFAIGNNDFMAHAITGVCLVGATLVEADFAATAPPLIQITEEGTDKTLFDRPQLWPNIVGTAERPNPMLPGYLFQAGRNVRVNFFATTATTLLAQVCLVGEKILL